MPERDHWDVRNEFNSDKVWESENKLDEQEPKPNPEPVNYRRLDRRERIALAEDIYEGRVFCDRQIQEKNMLMSVFMVLVFMDENQIASYQANPPGLIYEYFDQAGHMSVNGYPTFFSCRMLSQEEASKVLGIYQMIVNRKGHPSERKKV